MGGNVTLQYQLTSSMSVQAGYVTSLARHLEVFPGSNNITSIAPPGTALAGEPGPDTFPRFRKWGKLCGECWYERVPRPSNEG